MAAGTETEHARSVLHCVLHLFLNSKQRMKLETVNSDGIYFRSSCMTRTPWDQTRQEVTPHTPPPIKAGGTHPTGILSCFQYVADINDVFTE